MSRWLPWLNELQPEMFVEVSPELAGLRGLENGGWATVSTIRGEIEARVLVTERMRPLVMQGQVLHQVGHPLSLELDRALHRGCGQRADRLRRRPQRQHRGIQGVLRRDRAGPPVAEGEPRPPARWPSRNRRMAAQRDLPPVRQKPVGEHGLRAGKTELTEEA